MSVVQAIILGLVQGLTEFIPISSSGHLVYLHHVMGIEASGLTFDVALHFGTLMALIIYFYKDLWELVLGILGKNKQKRLAWLLVFATIPAVIAGILLESAAESKFRSPLLVSYTLIIFGLIMLLAERLSQARAQRSTLDKISNGQALAMGLAQAAAIVPGVSRSGSTITMGLLAGLDRVAATRFSFLLAIPITAGAIFKVFINGGGLNQASNQSAIFAIGIVTALLSGLFAIRFMLRFLAKHSLAVFAYYRIGLGVLAILLLTLR